MDGALSPDDVDALLARPLLARLATIDADGYPAIVPVWYEWRDRTFWIVARAASRYIDDIRRDPRVGMSVVADDDPDLRVQARGVAELVDGPRPLDGELLELGRRLARIYEGEDGLAYVEATRDRPRVLVRIRPTRLIGWGSPEWHPRYR